MAERPTRRNEALRNSWFEGAHEILATQGYGSLKLAPLCRKLGVTTGSFYHSFGNWQDFTEALLDNWLRERTELLAEIARRDPDPMERLEQLVLFVLQFDYRAEAAIRVWAGADARVGDIQRRVDAGRYQAAHDALVELVGPELAPSFAVWGLSTAVGYEMLSDQHGPEHLRFALEELLGLVLAAADQHRQSVHKTDRKKRRAAVEETAPSGPTTRSRPPRKPAGA